MESSYGHVGRVHCCLVLKYPSSYIHCTSGGRGRVLKVKMVMVNFRVFCKYFVPVEYFFPAL